MLFFRIRYTIRITRHVPRMHGVHSPLIYALLAEAWAAGGGPGRFVPDGVMVLAPEQLRVHLEIGDLYAFGMNLLAKDIITAAEIVHRVTLGLQQLGNKAARPSDTLGGNFELDLVEDLFGQKTLTATDQPAPLPPDHVLDECHRMAQQTGPVTLRFLTPLRWQRPKSLRLRGRRYFDGRSFDADVFLKRIPERLASLGLDTSGPETPIDYSTTKVLQNQLVWLDVDYRGARRKHIMLSGAAGEITLQLPPEFPRHWLVWAQYVHVGEASRFGHGRFRISELGEEPFSCRRSLSLASLMIQGQQLHQSALESGAAAGSVQQAAEAVLMGTYQPRPSRSLTLESIGRTPRQLNVPHPVDLALQRSLAITLQPGMDDLFETSSFAFRRGLGRHKAADAIQDAWKQGYRWAANADFERFFDTVGHAELKQRLNVWLADDRLVDIIMKWVTLAGQSSKGLPTGAPISPLLSNLFLDQFDEVVAEQGGRLVRYADDFLILTKTKHEAEAMFETARAAAADLQLNLNRDKAQLIDLSAPFQFLGFRFEKHREWKAVPGQGPVEIEHLGWCDASRERPRYAPQFLLPGESHRPSSLAGTTCLVEADAQWVGIQHNRISVSTSSGVYRSGPLVDGLQQLLILSPATLDESLIQAAGQHQFSILMTDEVGETLLEWHPAAPQATAELLEAQVRLPDNPERRLHLAKQLVFAKLMNYAALAEAIPSQNPQDDAATCIRQIAERISEAEAIDQLMGLEGSAAAAWYRSLNDRLPSRFCFLKRVAPRATDAVNVLLNIAQTHMYRQCQLASRLMGLAPQFGILHSSGTSHDALASDLQEPFRMLADRVAIECAWKLEPRDFHESESPRYPMILLPNARKRVLGMLHQTMAQTALGDQTTDPYSFRSHLFRLARSVKQCLLNPDDPQQLRVYVCPQNSSEKSDPTEPS